MTTETKTMQLELLFDRPAVPEPDRSHFFCITHQADRPLSEQSEDPRYCKECLEVIRSGEAQSYPAIRWSKCGLVEFLDGRSYTIDRKGHTVDIGREGDVLESFKTDVIAKDLCADRVPVLKQILKLREEIIDRQSGTDKPLRKGLDKKRLGNNQRSRPVGSTKRQGRHFKLSAPRQRASRR
jgi:hypothetical protein